MEKFKYTFTSIATGLKDLTIEVTKKQFDTLKAHLEENTRNNKNAESWGCTENHDLYYEHNMYFEFKSKDGFVLYILTKYRANSGCMFV